MNYFKKLFYRPQWFIVILDLIIWGFATSFIILWRIIADKAIIGAYMREFILLALIWMTSGYLFKKYKKKTVHKNISEFRVVNLTSLVTFAFIIFFHFVLNFKQSVWVIMLEWMIVSWLNIIVLALHFAYRYATSRDVEPIVFDSRPHVSINYKPTLLSKEAYQKDIDTIIKASDNKTVEELEDYIRLNYNDHLILNVDSPDKIDEIKPYAYNAIINLEVLNNIRGINRMFSKINEKLPDNGLWICSFRTAKQQKKLFIKKYKPFIGHIFFGVFYLVRNTLPHIFITHRIYYDLTKGKRRVFSSIEIAGRLYYCGFEIEKTFKQNDRTFVIARRHSQPNMLLFKHYGTIIKLPRIGKNKERIFVYKMRTMYPYSEYLQEYICQKHGLREGGKIKNDIRINKVGAFMRKYWLDELPMVLNIIRGQMKLVGVRPLSKHYFSLYSEELQELRTQFKPGLLPPFYADMPQTLDEIQSSEMKYLKLCKKNGEFVTDFTYFWKILNTILFKKARSG